MAVGVTGTVATGNPKTELGCYKGNGKNITGSHYGWSIYPSSCHSNPDPAWKGGRGRGGGGFHLLTGLVAELERKLQGMLCVPPQNLPGVWAHVNLPRMCYYTLTFLIFTSHPPNFGFLTSCSPIKGLVAPMFSKSFVASPPVGILSVLVLHCLL